MKNLLAHTSVYLFFQWLAGGIKARRHCVRDHVAIRPGLRILDIGCGPGYIVDDLPGCHYVGYDIDATYIDYAKRHHGHKARFHCKTLTAADLAPMPPFDVVFMFGVLHHLDDHTAHTVLNLAKSALAEGGYLLTLDGCFTPEARSIGLWMLNNDRGEHVRTEQAYRDLAEPVFDQTELFIRDDLFHVPYPNAVMKCRA